MPDRCGKQPSPCGCYADGIADTEAKEFDEKIHLVDQLSTERAATEALMALIEKILPEVFVCVECGPFMKSDEDGCCGTCGSDGAIIVPFDAAYVTYKERRDGG